MLVVDAANVIGARPDGWWRDRAGAADRLIARLRAALESGVLPAPVLVVLEGRARDAAARTDDELRGELQVVRASGSGDDRIVELTASARADGAHVTVVTADRGLTARVRALGAEVQRPGHLLQQLTWDA